jgi:hypothetical protein
MFGNNSSFDVQVTSSINVFPEPRYGESTSVPLSIIDNAVAGFAKCSAVWFYDSPSNSSLALSSSHLQASLSKTLNYYPQWCGRLSYATPDPKKDHNHRYQRIWVTYNTSADVGIPFITATSAKRLADFLPSTEARKSSLKAWDPSTLPSSELLPKMELAISDDKDAPNVIIQFTTFSCGSTAVAIAITHCLADAVAMSQFAKDWSTMSRAMVHGETLPILTPVFNPQLLDSFAAGDLDISEPDIQIQAKARGLSQHRYDWYLHVPGQPWPTHTPPDFNISTLLSPSTPINWEQWDVKAPVSHRVLHFSPAELQHIYKLATPSSAKISKHDALLAHIWSRINASRNLPIGTKTYLDMTFGLRARVSPPLPDSFLGSPITIAAIPYTISSSSASLSSLAQTIRSTLSVFTPEAISHYLHDQAFEVAPQRLWRGCLGREHILLTTWVYSGVYDVDFIGGQMPRYVEAVMPSCDGLVEVMEAPGVEKKRKGGSWIDDGVDVSVFLEEKAMERLLVDKSLWGGA